MAYADITGDGQSDILWQNTCSGDMYYSEMNGTISIGGDYLAYGFTEWRLAAADMTGGGLTDILWHNVYNGDVYYWKLNETASTGGDWIVQNVSSAWHIVGCAKDGR